MIITAYYTPDYKIDYSLYLKSSLEKIDGLKYDVIEVPDRGNWSLNTFYTPSVIKKMLEKYPRDAVVKVGVDAYLHEYPRLFDKIEKTQETDVAITYRPQDPIIRPDCATVLVMNNDNGRYFCNEWDKACKEKEKNLTMVFCDMEVLWTIMDKILKKIRITRLPYSYGQSWHFDKKQSFPIIEEFRTSWHHNRNKI